MRNAIICIAATVVVVSLSQPRSATRLDENNGQAISDIQTGHRLPMPEMTFPELESAAGKTGIVLLPIGSIEEHGPHLPLATDSIIATSQLLEVQEFLRTRGVETVVGPVLNVGITTDAGDWSRDGTYIYPGSLTVSADTFVALYLDVIRSLRDNRLRRVFVYSGHFGPRHVRTVARIAEEANRRISEVRVQALIESDLVARLALKPGPALLSIEGGRNFELLAKLLGKGLEMPNTTHADGTETSLMLYWRPDLVRRGYQQHEPATSSRFFDAYRSGNREKNPTGMGGFPLGQASSAAGKEICEDRARRMADTILRAFVDAPSPR
ncbi:MAG TPA: creatininase family protein [Blastocatellia bacterium]|nr:creatininase family protein [Blastocatellia bacterium]